MTGKPDLAAPADEKTDLAEDRTVLANERTFAGWMRTGLAAIGVGVGFNALFGAMEPPWVPRAIATLLLAIGAFIVIAAERRACQVISRMQPNHVRVARPMVVRLIAYALALVALLLMAAIWLLPLDPAAAGRA